MLPINHVLSFFGPSKPAVQIRKPSVSAILSEYLRKKESHRTSNCGLINVGNSCYINSVLQSLASLPYFEQCLEHLCEVSISTSFEPAVAAAMLTTISDLRYGARYCAFIPQKIVKALSNNKRLTSQDQQDAQEFFQLLSASLSAESTVVYRTSYCISPETKELESTKFKGKTFGGLGLKYLAPKPVKPKPESDEGIDSMVDLLITDGRMILPTGKRVKMGDECRMLKSLQNPFVGLVASRLTCAECGYTAAVRHFTFDNLSLALPNARECDLEECLMDYIRIETLEDANCRRCTLKATLRWFEGRLAKEGLDGKLKNDLEERKEAIVNALNLNPEDEIQGVNLVRKGGSKVSTKQLMIAQPPKVLCLHLQRSDYFSEVMFAQKNTCFVRFPLVLDLGPYCTTGHVCTDSAYTPMSNDDTRRILYRLKAMIVHYGSHYDGHFVAFCMRGSQWIRISDDQVTPVDAAHVQSENPYMLFYEKIASLSFEDHEKGLDGLIDDIVQKMQDKETAITEY